MRSQTVNIDLGERALHDRARAGFLWLLQPRRGRGDYGKRTGARGQRAACARCHRRRASRPSLLRSSRPPAVYADCCTSRRCRSAATATAPPASASSGPALAASARAPPAPPPAPPPASRRRCPPRAPSCRRTDGPARRRLTAASVNATAATPLPAPQWTGRRGQAAVPHIAAAQYRARARERRICAAAGGHVGARSARFFAHFWQEWAVIVKKIFACGALLAKLFFSWKNSQRGSRSVGAARRGVSCSWSTQ